MIDICTSYAKTWSFNYGIKKTKCMTLGKNVFVNDLTWYLNEHPITNVNSIEILRFIFNNNSSNHGHIEKRISKCQGHII
jgi:hypothetical protein